ncbi:MAG: ABC transporter permease [Acidobacteriota bacterium]
MAVPIIYNLRSIKARWATAIVAVAGIAGAVSVFVAMLGLAKGFQATLISSGSSDNAIVRQAGSTSEMVSLIMRDEADIISTAPGVARDSAGRPIVSAEAVVVISLPRRDTGTDANVQLRGVSEDAMQLRDSARVVAGRFFRAGTAELVVGTGVQRSIRGLQIGDRPKIGGREWQVVGVFDSGGSAFDSELWVDVEVVLPTFNRPLGVYQSMTVRLTSPEVFQNFKDALTADRRQKMTVERELDYYEKQSRMVATVIRSLGFLVAFVMGIGAVFGALNTMYSAVAARGREIATLRALGFRSGSIVASFVFESLVIAFIGGMIGCTGSLGVNGMSVSTINWQTFSHLAFAFRVTPALLAAGIAFALLMGFLGGLPPAIRATRLSVAAALREL